MAQGDLGAQDSTVPSPPQMTAPPTATATHFALTFTVNEILVGLGHSRFVMMAGPDGMASPGLLPEMFLALSLSPPSVVQLADILTNCIRVYEDRFGPIPRDKGAQLNVQVPGEKQGE